MSAYQSRDSVQPTAFEKFRYSLTRASFGDVDQYQIRPPVGAQTHILCFRRWSVEYGHPQNRTWRRDYLRRLREICVKLKSDLRNPWNACMPPCLLADRDTSRKVTCHHATTALSLSTGSRINTSRPIAGALVHTARGIQMNSRKIHFAAIG
jgi:hypothetical protein